MKLTASRLRANIYRILDRVAKTGEPVEVQRGDRTLVILPKEEKFNKLKRLKRQRLTNEDSDNFIHLDWSLEWKDSQ